MAIALVKEAKGKKPARYSVRGRYQDIGEEIAGLDGEHVEVDCGNVFEFKTVRERLCFVEGHGSAAKIVEELEGVVAGLEWVLAEAAGKGKGFLEDKDGMKVALDRAGGQRERLAEMILGVAGLLR